MIESTETTPINTSASLPSPEKKKTRIYTHPEDANDNAQEPSAQYTSECTPDDLEHMSAILGEGEHTGSIPTTNAPRPNINAASMIPNFRPSRILNRKHEDPFASASYGISIHKPKPEHALRVYFQNIKGLSHSTNSEDYRYVLQQLDAIKVDISGLAETNSAWQHPYLRYEFNAAIKASGIRLSKVSYASPSQDVDNVPTTETFQAGGSITATLGSWTTAVFGSEIYDETGMGRWSGIHLRGRYNNTLSIITGYRSCCGSKFTAPLGSTFHREYEHLRTRHGMDQPNPRLQFVKDIEQCIRKLQDSGNMVLLMLDANGTLSNDINLSKMAERLQLHDLHSQDPAPSTYIASSDRRIDYMFGCSRTRDAIIASGTLSYIEGPQSDHRGLSNT
jgi:hypothetical protein